MHYFCSITGDDTFTVEVGKVKKEATVKLREPKPNAVYDDNDGMIKGLTADGTYNITANGVSKDVVADRDGNINVEEYIGKTISLVKKGTSEKLNSVPQNIIITIKIESVNITDITMPNAGQAFVNSANCSNEGVSNISFITWTPSGEVAAYGTEYTGSITIVPYSNYKFTDNIAVKINGQTPNSVTHNEDRTLTVTFKSTTIKAKLQSIINPDDISVNNGVSYKNFGLPQTVSINTEDGIKQAEVSWGDKPVFVSGSYDSSKTAKQSFVLKGIVTVPSNIDDNDVLLETTINVTVRGMAITKVPEVNINPGTYSENQSIVLSSITDGSEIYYTTDGSTPSEYNGIRYSGAISVNGIQGECVVTTIKAIAVKFGMLNSSVMTFDYTINLPKVHEHEYSTEWVSDETSHWHECECGDKIDEALHTVSGWIIDKEATKTEEGSKHKKCTVCHRILETEVIPMIKDTDSDSGDSEDTGSVIKDTNVGEGAPETNLNNNVSDSL